jgi:hypothetical protein
VPVSKFIVNFVLTWKFFLTYTDDKRILKGEKVNQNNDPKKLFIDAFREQRKALEGCLKFWKK